MVRAHITVPRHSDANLMGIMEKRISGHFTNYCVEPIDGLGIYTVTKDHKIVRVLPPTLNDQSRLSMEL
jgi:hypothetical protein